MFQNLSSLYRYYPSLVLIEFGQSQVGLKLTRARYMLAFDVVSCLCQVYSKADRLMSTGSGGKL